jgi:phage/plasmid-associated DNA primase
VNNTISIDLRIQLLIHFNRNDVSPETATRQSHVDPCISSVERFINQWVTGNIQGVPICPCKSTDLYALYLMWCLAKGEKYPLSNGYFFRELIYFPGWKKKKRRIQAAVPLTAPIVLPPQNVLQGHGSDRPDNISVSSWISDSANQFSCAVDKARSAGKWIFS